MNGPSGAEGLASPLCDRPPRWAARAPTPLLRHLADPAVFTRPDRELLERILDQLGEGVLIAGPRGEVVRANRAFVTMTGYSEDEVRGRRPPFWLFEGVGRGLFAAIGRSLRASGQWVGELKGRRKNGASYPASLKVSAVRSRKGRVTHHVAILADISRAKSDEALIAQMRDLDPLTGLPNWDLMVRRLDQAVAAARGGAAPVSVLLLDLDGFKAINDSLGEACGDYVVEIMAERLVRCAGEGAVVARRGSDDFGLVLRSGAGLGEIAAIAQRILAALAEPFQLAGEQYALTASVGISLFPGDGEASAPLLAHAGAALDVAKAEGGDSFQFFSRELRAAALERLVVGRGLHQALERGELVVHYQPQVALASGRIIGVEALVRWRHPEMGIIPPASFIPLAEETGQIVPIGEWVLREACRQGRLWHEAGFPRLKMAVNLSPRQFRHGRLAARIEAALADTGFDASLLELEITESALMADPEAAARMLAHLKSMGIRVSIDDFGTGYSSLGYLKRLPVDGLKIDRSFVSDCCDKRRDAAIVSAVIGLARELALEVVAEGVENAGQLAYLHRQRCELGQGYYFSRPLAADGIRALLAGGSLPAATLEPVA